MQLMPVPTDLFDRWTKRRDELRQLGAIVDGAAICEEVLADLGALQQTERDTVLTLTAAARISGYSADHLGRLIRDGKILNVGRRGPPRIRLTDLPRRPQSPLAGNRLKVYDPDADARSLLSRRGERHHDV